MKKQIKFMLMAVLLVATTVVIAKQVTEAEPTHKQKFGEAGVRVSGNSPKVESGDQTVVKAEDNRTVAKSRVAAPKAIKHSFKVKKATLNGKNSTNLSAKTSENEAKSAKKPMVYGVDYVKLEAPPFVRQGN